MQRAIDEIWKNVVWKEKIMKGVRNKPEVKKRFVRIRGTLYSYRNEMIKVSIRPNQEHLEFDVLRAWFLSRVPRRRNGGLSWEKSA